MIAAEGGWWCQNAHGMGCDAEFLLEVIAGFSAESVFSGASCSMAATELDDILVVHSVCGRGGRKEEGCGDMSAENAEGLAGVVAAVEISFVLDYAFEVVAFAMAETVMVGEESESVAVAVDKGVVVGEQPGHTTESGFIVAGVE